MCVCDCVCDCESMWCVYMCMCVCCVQVFIPGLRCYPTSMNTAEMCGEVESDESDDWKGHG